MRPDSSVEKEFRLLPAQKSALKKLGISTVRDLLYHFPVRYSDASTVKYIKDIEVGETASIFGTISDIKLKKSFRTRVPMTSAKISDETGSIMATWFHQPYIAKMVQDGARLKFTGKITEGKSGMYISNPEYEQVTKAVTVGDSLFGEKDAGDLSSTYPIYPESRGVTSKWFYHAIQKAFGTGILSEMPDPIPDAIVKKYNLPSFATAMVWIHAPKKQSDADAARKRFAFEEVFMIQVEKQRAKLLWQNNPAFVIEKDKADIEKFVSRFPFEATAAQKNAIETILSDFKKGHAMARLLEGDVGSGKTAVAATTAYAVVTSRPKGQNYGALQVAYMCPTEILAGQHFESFIKYFAHAGIQVGLITGSGCKKFPSKINPEGYTDISRSQLLKWVANGEIPIVVGTHALIQKSVTFKHLAYAIIDEQHRFGTKQRQSLAEKHALYPHLLSMTATPIPRTLALTIFGDLDLTLLDEMPKGRKRIITEIVRKDRRDDMYERVRKEIGSGRQAYVICPRIDEPDPTKEMAVNAKSVKEEAKRLKKDVFPEFEIDILHGKMSPSEKESVMEEFSAGKTHILVATSLVEVGVNVPNATVILIEGAERFGLAQLHQLRGRVIRSTHQAYCYVFTDSGSQKTLERLKALTSAANGFELAEFDLVQRGAGELGGGKQWGVSDLAMEALKNLKMVEAARTEAAALIESNPDLTDYPEIKKRVENAEERIHFE